MSALQPDRPLVEFARDEVQRAGLFDSDSDYDGMLGRAVLALVETFAAQGHSGTSARITLDLFDKVARYQPLTPLTFTDDQWVKHGPDVWQHRRNPAVFTSDQGRTWYDLDEPGRPSHPTGVDEGDA